MPSYMRDNGPQHTTHYAKETTEISKLNMRGGRDTGEAKPFK